MAGRPANMKAWLPHVAKDRRRDIVIVLAPTLAVATLPPKPRLAAAGEEGCGGGGEIIS